MRFTFPQRIPRQDSRSETFDATATHHAHDRGELAEVRHPRTDGQNASLPATQTSDAVIAADLASAGAGLRAYRPDRG